MGSSHPFLLSPPTLHYHTINPSKTSLNPNFSSQFRCFFSSKPRRNPNSDPFRGDQFGFRQKQRNWWSDDDDDDNDDNDDDFGFWKEPSAIDWFFKILGTFGWIIPAVIISTVLGNESNSLIMALVLPLGQTALSLVMDKLWVGPSSSPTPRPRPRTKGRGRAPRTGTRPMRRAENSKSSAKKNQESGSEFGGWDELDELSNVGVAKDRSNQMGEELGKESRDENVKLSTRRKSEKPLFMRLLIAVFPFLGSWSRFLF